MVCYYFHFVALKSDTPSSIVPGGNRDNTPETVTADTPKLISPTKYTTIYVMYERGVIRVGKNPFAPVLEITDPEIPTGQRPYLAFAAPADTPKTETRVRFEKDTFDPGINLIIVTEYLLIYL